MKIVESPSSTSSAVSSISKSSNLEFAYKMNACKKRRPVSIVKSNLRFNAALITVNIPNKNSIEILKKDNVSQLATSIDKITCNPMLSTAATAASFTKTTTILTTLNRNDNTTIASATYYDNETTSLSLNSIVGCANEFSFAATNKTIGANQQLKNIKEEKIEKARGDQLNYTKKAIC